MAKTPTRPRKAGRTGRALLVAATLTGLAAVPAAAAVTAPDAPATTDTTRASAADPKAAEPRAADPRAAEERQQSAEASPARDGSPGPVYERVAHFYAAYIDVANDPGDNTAAAELRKFYLTPELRDRLRTWEQHHEADGILMAQNVPSAWKVTSGDSGMGHTWSTVRLTWGTGQGRHYTYLAVQSDLATRKISDIKSKY